MSRASWIHELVEQKYPFYTTVVRGCIDKSVYEHDCRDTDDVVINAIWNLKERELFKVAFPEEKPIQRGRHETHFKALTDTSREKLRHFIDEARKYEAHLKNHDDDALRTLFVEVMTPVLGAQKIWRIRHENRHDQWAFFNRPESIANFETWRTRLLTADQLTALSFNKDPNVVNIDRIGREIGGPLSSPFADEYRKRLQLIELSVSKGELYELNPMGLFIEWAKSTGLQIADEMSGIDSKRYESEIASLELRITNLIEENTALRAHIDHLESNASEFKPKTKRSVYKLILGMAHDKFKFQPIGRTSGVTNIRTCLENQGLSLDDDTIRYHLNEARALLESDWEPLPKG